MTTLKDVPFSRPFGKEFIRACKDGNYEVVSRLLELDPSYVHEYDDIRMTGLHWACKKGFERIVDYLLDNHADPRAEDILKRPAEFFAKISNKNQILNAIYTRTKKEKVLKQIGKKKEHKNNPNKLSQTNDLIPDQTGAPNLNESLGSQLKSKGLDEME